LAEETVDIVMRSLLTILAVTQICVVAFGADWLTDGKNSQRTNWQQDEKTFTTANAKDIKLLWKVQLDNQRARCTRSSSR
jgi:hypothetical protein